MALPTPTTARRGAEVKARARARSFTDTLLRGREPHVMGELKQEQMEDGSPCFGSRAIAELEWCVCGRELDTPEALGDKFTMVARESAAG